MATTTSQQRAQLLRDLNKTRSSSGSSRHSQSPHNTISDFDPENEAMMSTRQFDYDPARTLPQLRASAQKYKHPTPPEPDYFIDTSALGKAFPDFTQGSGSSDGSLSIEVGRGTKKPSTIAIGKLGLSEEHSSNIDLDEDSMNFKAPMIGKYEVTGTPPLRRSTKQKADAAKSYSQNIAPARRPSGLRNQLDPSPPAKTKDYGSNDSRKSSNGSHRTLSAMHARVRDENDVSQISDSRPAPVDQTTRNTRFGSGTSSQNALDKNLPAVFDFTRGPQAPKPTKNFTSSNVAATPQGTFQSFVLPDVPNMSELVSGVFEDGTPVFSRQGNSKASRFAAGRGKGINLHDGVHNLALPDDEQAILLSLKLLEDKVAMLERSKAEAEVALKDLEEQNEKLRSEQLTQRRTSHRSDSALGTTDSDDGNDMAAGGHRKATIERNRLQSSIRSLQMQLDAANRKASTTETILKSITQERDSAVSQLSVAFVTVEQLKLDNASVMQENRELKARISQMADEHSVETKQWVAKESALQQDLERHDEDTRRWAAKESALQQNLERHGEQTREWAARESALYKKLERMDQAIKSAKDSDNLNVAAPRARTSNLQDRTQGSTASRGQLSKTHRLSDDDELFDLSPRDHDKPKKSSMPKRTLNAQEDSRITENFVADERLQTNGIKVSDQQETNHDEGDTQTGGASQEITFLSFMNTGEMAKLRRTIEQERLEQKQRNAARHQGMQKELASAQEEQPAQLLSRKSSVQDITSRSNLDPKPKEPTVTVNSKKDAENTRRHSETSMLSSRSRRRNLNTENMTSAFIVPDITIRAPTEKTEALVEASKANQKILENLANHQSRKCTVCKVAVKSGERHSHDGKMNNRIAIPKPVPVSERMPEPIPGEEDPTLRPAQAPGLALATVLKGLEDEVAHMKIKLAKYQTLYNGHDPSLSKRQRKSVHQKMEVLLQAIDTKADQIYALYDVLEGQKQADQELTQEEVEITLQSIGIGNTQELEDDHTEVTAQNTETARHPWDLKSDVSEDDLPWEGIESTVETTTSGLTRAGRKRASAA